MNSVCGEALSLCVVASLARIQRAWLRPRTPIDADVFACRVQIIQDRNGTVSEVTLKRCNGDTRWQMSLVRAIQQASPLPAPPDSDVFTTTLTFELESEPFSAAGNTEGFEPETSATIAAAAR
jgi:TonB family protein